MLLAGHPGFPFPWQPNNTHSLHATNYCWKQFPSKPELNQTSKAFFLYSSLSPQSQTNYFLKTNPSALSLLVFLIFASFYRFNKIPLLPFALHLWDIDLEEGGGRRMKEQKRRNLRGEK
jgi:hypothetical protein